MKAKELTEKKDTELTLLLVEKRETLRTFRFGNAGSATRDTHAARKNRRDIARILTEQNRRG